MKKLLISIVLLSLLVFKLHGQLSVGLRLGVSPEQNPSTPYLVLNRTDPVNQCLFNLEKVTFKPQVGLMVRTENDQFWFAGEILYSQTSSYYSVEYLYRSYFTAPLGEPATGNDIEEYKIQKDYLELPVSAGFKLGMFEISSGLSISKNLKVDNQFEDFAGYTTLPSRLTWGWHAGLGVNLQLVLLELRYQRDFTNYGDNQFINGHELTIPNQVDRLSAMIDFRFQ